ncbi:bifunctional adenosylcobinamide kinase/adenosylcobinamide-phosphate guanylyltransferase [Moraxella caviae]|uniref:Bifunctional adenosylcobalamin biosynthesis protein n=1 Tax=Moraxella caviae TaxID=34060 RepID=A0A1T0A2H6_9GAMM|nr:bifunctional adenosylcobinamide kinase/adenosylcobinamide-phosphate guanylyltransferase [Moraxella caviae]OOR89887.1 bifunctional adenosylcobinamide kinase/adenosylcobinamide-phosphate guanylyltransferase [Moraxella caviae]STZ14272.1 Adenosylcobinamide kinase [Moraxella caviae]
MIHLILGGARSGKSRHAETLAKASNKKVIYIATAQAFDDEMHVRISHHQNSRPKHWQTLETPIKLAETLTKWGDDDSVLLVDCLTLWLSNLLLAGDDVFESESQAFLDVLATYQGELILVSNETGLGVVPMGELSRRFVDESGFLHQKLAQIADEVVFCVAGLPMMLKSAK